MSDSINFLSNCEDKLNMKHRILVYIVFALIFCCFSLKFDLYSSDVFFRLRSPLGSWYGETLISHIVTEMIYIKFILRSGYSVVVMKVHMRSRTEFNLPNIFNRSSAKRSPLFSIRHFILDKAQGFQLS